MAHQTHGLPWNTLASHVKYMFSHTHEPKRKDIFAVERENEEKEVDYFCRALVQRIGEFSQTDRAKFAPREAYQRRAESSPRTADVRAADDQSGDSEGARRLFRVL